MTQIRSMQDFDSVYQLMEQSFPPNERRTYEEQKALLNNSRYNISIVPGSKKHSLNAFLAYWTLGDLIFIEHFAVNPLCRNTGLGSALLQDMIRQQTHRICLEVELPENDLAKRRIRFYERNGFFLNQYPYVQPSISKGRSPIPLLIMTSGQPVSEKIFQEIKSTLYEYVYGVTEQDKKRLFYLDLTY